MRRAVDHGPGAANPAVREGVEALIRMLTCFAPFTAEEGWQRLGHRPSVLHTGWPTAEPDLLAVDSVVCVSPGRRQGP